MIDSDFSEEFDRLRDKPLTVEVKQWREKRSKNANAYMWVLCEKIAQTQGIGAEEVYRHNIREVGVFKDDEVDVEDVKWRCTSWGMLGKGWIAERVDFTPDGKREIIRFYYGSSQYNSQQMARLIDNIVQDAQALGIPTDPREELDRLIKEWDR